MGAVSPLGAVSEGRPTRARVEGREGRVPRSPQLPMYLERASVSGGPASTEE